MQQFKMLAAALTSALAVIAAPAFGQFTSTTIVNDSFTDGDRFVSGASGSDIETNFYTTSTSAAIEDNVTNGVGTGIVGLVSGTSGRQIHTTFASQTLAAGDTLSAYLTFTTPGFVATNATQADFDAAAAAAAAAGDTGTFSVGSVPASSDDIRLGLFGTSTGFNNNGNIGLDEDVSNSSATPIPALFIPGYAVELDVDNASTTNQDLNIRRTDPDNFSGRLLGTNTGVDNFADTDDLGYVFAPDTQYQVHQSVFLNGLGELEISVGFEDLTNGISIGSFSAIDASPVTLEFGTFAIGASSEAFGLSNDAGIPDNGIDINNFTLVLSSVPEPSSLTLLGLMGCAGFIRRRR